MSGICCGRWAGVARSLNVAPASGTKRPSRRSVERTGPDRKRPKKRPYDSKRPVVCLDETSKQLIGEVGTPIPAAPGHVAQNDYEYVRNGVANIFMIFEPLAGQRNVEVTNRRTKEDYAECLRKISDRMYPDAEVVVLVQDNLNTHSPASLYEAFAPAEAKRPAERFECHYTPKHGSWLDMAEIELGILGRQCLSRRIDNTADLCREAKAWEAEGDAAGTKLNWQFTTTDARIKRLSRTSTDEAMRTLDTNPCTGMPYRPWENSGASVSIWAASRRASLAAHKCFVLSTIRFTQGQSLFWQSVIAVNANWRGTLCLGTSQTGVR